MRDLMHPGHTTREFEYDPQRGYFGLVVQPGESGGPSGDQLDQRVRPRIQRIRMRKRTAGSARRAGQVVTTKRKPGFNRNTGTFDALGGRGHSADQEGRRSDRRADRTEGANEDRTGPATALKPPDPASA